jgi:hypothetical protein
VETRRKQPRRVSAGITKAPICALSPSKRATRTLRQAQGTYTDEGALRQAQDTYPTKEPFDRLRAHQAPSAGVHIQIGREAFGHFDDRLQFGMPHDDHSVTDQDGAPIASGGTDWEQVHHHDVLAIFSQ